MTQQQEASASSPSSGRRRRRRKNFVLRSVFLSRGGFDMTSSNPRSVLETDFPLMSPPPPPADSSVPAAGSYGQYRYGRSASSGYGGSQAGSLQRPGQQQQSTPTGSYRPLSAYLNASSSGGTKPATTTDWRYQSTTTSSSGGGGRAGSLRRAYDEENPGGVNADENQPLVATDGGQPRPSPQRSQISSTTSDYHSNGEQQQQQQSLLSEAKKEPIEVALKKQQKEEEERRKRIRRKSSQRYHAYNTRRKKSLFLHLLSARRIKCFQRR